LVLSYPKDWTQSTKDLELVLLDVQDQRFIEIQKKMNCTIHKHKGYNFKSYNILSIHRVQNKKLYANFRLHVESFVTHKENEMFLFHGTTKHKDIINNGLDPRYGNAGMFGRGIYFADQSSKSNQYSRPESCKKNGHAEDCRQCERVMFYCRVVIGKVCERKHGNSSLTVAPDGYDSVKGIPSKGGLRFSEYIVYHQYQAYPEYLIEYKMV
jgi:hypothetical protein